jgi:predicted site-specific integrase-resolvase
MTVAHAQPDEKVPTAERILVSEKVAAELCSVSQVTFRKWVAAGAIRPVDIPGDIRRNLYRRVDIEAFAAGRAASA